MFYQLMPIQNNSGKEINQLFLEVKQMFTASSFFFFERNIF